MSDKVSKNSIKESSRKSHNKIKEAGRKVQEKFDTDRKADKELEESARIEKKGQ